MAYLVKKIQRQEMGSMSSASTNPARGRYFYITKDKRFLDEFPPLSEDILNDFSLLSIIPLYENEFKRNYVKYVYHNDKFHLSSDNKPGTRNEYRIYLNRSLESNGLVFKESDIVVLKPQKLKSVYSADNHVEDVYFLYLVTDEESELYQDLELKIKKSTIRGNYARVEEEILEIENRIDYILSKRFKEPTTVESNIESVNEIISYLEKRVEASTLIDQRKKEIYEGGIFRSQTQFRDFLTVAYEERCCITEKVISVNGFNNLEAAHIYPRSHGGTYNPNNGFLLGRDLHWAFDLGCFTIDDNYIVCVHPEVKDDYLRSLHHKKILLPKSKALLPDKNNLRYHRENIYGLFLKRGRI